jgi:hypothetical protein
MSPSDPRYLLKQAFIFPIGVAYVILNFMMLVTDAGRKYARYWLAVLFALPLAVLSSSSACFVWLLAYLVNHGWVRTVFDACTCIETMYRSLGRRGSVHS